MQKIFGFLKGVVKFISDWWHNQKWVVKKFIFPLIDSYVKPLIEKKIREEKEEIIKMLQELPEKEVAEKAGEWGKKVLEETLDLNK